MIGKIIQKSLKIVNTPDQPNPKMVSEQHETLRSLLTTARRTAFGRHHSFDQILRSDSLLESFQNNVPIAEYDDFYRQWWRFAHADEADVTWPGKIPYFALSSGTSGAASKYIPVTQAMLSQMKKGSRRMFFDLSKYDLPEHQFKKQMLMVGSCTSLTQCGQHLEGDLSGIIGLNRPLWLSKYYRPGRAITDLPEWHSRIAAITEEAPLWDIGFVVGNPAWVQMIFESIIHQYGLRDIHDIWPNLAVYAHGGVFFEPYQHHFEQLLGKKIHYIDSYMASEGFFAYQNRPGSRHLRLLPDCGIFFEFLPFTDYNFDENGTLRPHARAVGFSQVEEGKNYALVLSTCAGAWRYLLGDTVAFTDVSRAEFRLTGRTKQFLSICGEHLSVDNLNEAVCRVDKKLDAGVIEFTVAGVPFNNQWAHRWFVSLKNPAISPTLFADMVDAELCRLNDDYAIERRYALREVTAELLSASVFYQWLEQRGKLNGQAKIPRVLKGEQLSDWMSYLKDITVND
jgi:hypothetical protein